MRRTAILLVVFCLTLSAAATRGVSGATEHAIIVVLDGIRSTEGFDDPTHANVPRMWNNLRPIGVRIPEFHNDGWTMTLPGHASILTSTWQFLPDDGSQRPTSPTIFELFRSITGAPASATWLVSSKTKLEACGYSTAAGYGAPDSARADCTNRTDRMTYAAYASHLAADHPIVSLFHLGDIDVIAHSGDWAGYNRAIAIADSLVYELWMLVESDPALSGRTAMFVTCDHGRHDDAHGGFMNHGDACMGCVRLPFLALGPGFAAGREGTIVRDQRDIVPTIGSLLGFATPGAQGHVMTELWADVTSVDSEAPPARALVTPNPTSGAVRFVAKARDGAGPWRLRVWDLSGRLVHDAGIAANAAIAWDGRDRHGRNVEAGEYFWQLEAGRFRQRGTITVIH